MSAGLRAGTNNDGFLQINGTDVLTALSSVRVGIGTSAPVAPFDIFKTSYPEMNIRTGTVTSTFGIDTGDNHTVIGPTTSHNLRLVTAGQSRVTLNSSGNLGVGTTNPGYKFHLYHNSATDSALFETNQAFVTFTFKSTTNTSLPTIGLNSLGELEFDQKDATKNIKFGFGGQGTKVTITPAGNVGIGTINPDRKLWVEGNSATTDALEVYARGAASTNNEALFQFHNDDTSGSTIRPSLKLRAGWGVSDNSEIMHFVRRVGSSGTGTSWDYNLQILAAGKVGIGTLADTGWQLHVATNNSADVLKLHRRQMPGTESGPNIAFQITQTNGQSATLGALGSTFLSNWGGSLDFYTKSANGAPNNTIVKRGSILPTGEFRLGTTDTTIISSDPAHALGDVGFNINTNNLARLSIQDRLSNFISFKNASATHYGTIAVSGSGVSYGSNSDYRLKENISTIDNAIQKIKDLKPITFNFITSPDNQVDGFLAHEVQEIAPYAVNGEKDGYDISGDILDDEGNIIKKCVPEPSLEELEEGQTWVETNRSIKIQQLDPAKLVPILTAALQEAIAKIESLEERISILES